LVTAKRRQMIMELGRYGVIACVVADVSEAA
jgi:hypothetical protein